MKKNETHVWMIEEGRVYNNGYIKSATRTKKIAETKCKDDGFTYSNKDALWIKSVDGIGYWRDIWKLEFYTD